MYVKANTTRELTHKAGRFFVSRFCQLYYSKSYETILMKFCRGVKRSWARQGESD